jgi:hypothetical protein
MDYLVDKYKINVKIPKNDDSIVPSMIFSKTPMKTGNAIYKDTIANINSGLVYTGGSDPDLSYYILIFLFIILLVYIYCKIYGSNIKLYTSKKLCKKINNQIYE